MLNQNFGTNVPSYRPDSDWVTGWGKRPYNWQTSVSVDREILPSLVVSAGYYRTWYGNFMVVDNQSVVPGDFSPYCVTVPTDSRLPSSVASSCAGCMTSTPTGSDRSTTLSRLPRTTAGTQRSTTAWT